MMLEGWVIIAFSVAAILFLLLLWLDEKENGE